MIKNRYANVLLFLLVVFSGGRDAARAQAFDPRPSLNTLISAFQRCGPPAAYQMLSPYLFTLVAQQTGGTGCYQFMAAAGPVLRMDVIESRLFPVGPVYAIRVTHATGAVDWFIGFNQVTGRVEYLTYQAVSAGAAPSIEAGPDPDKTIGGVKPSDRSTGRNQRDDDGAEAGPEPEAKRADLSEACKKFPQMCP